MPRLKIDLSLLSYLVAFPDLSLPLTDPVLVFSLVLFIILLAPILLRLLRIPGLIGLIVAGVVIGPHGLNFLERNAAIELFGTVGLLYIMFLAGLELDMNEFRKNKHKSLLFGAFTFFIPLLFGLPICYYLLGYDLKAAILIASMFATHTLVGYPIASILGIVKNEAVAITVGGTIITDTVVLIILAVVIGSSKGELNSEFWISFIAGITLFMLIVFLLFPPVARWFFRNSEGEKSSQYIFVLAMVFLAGFLASLAGVEPIIGAFMSGLALNRLIPHTSPLMNRIEFVGNTLFIPFFLISVGMLVDLKVLLKGPEALTVSAVLVSVALSTKWIAAYITQKVFKYTKAQRQVIFGLSSAHAAATLAVILVGFNIGLIDEKVLNGTILIILITCLVASFVTAKAGRQLAIIESKKPVIAETGEKILVPISNPATIETLIDLAVIAKDTASPAPITALAIVLDDEEAKERVLKSNQMLEKAIIHAAATDTKVEVTSRVDVNVASGISRAIKELFSTLVIIGWTEKIRPTGRIFGSMLDNLLSYTRQMLWVCKLTQPMNIMKRMIVAVPQNAELETGFEKWVVKILEVAKQSGQMIHLYCTQKTQSAFLEVAAKIKASVKVSYTPFEFWDDFLILSKDIQANDLVVIVSGRVNTISYDAALDHMPFKLSKYMPQQSFIIVYPEQSNASMIESVITATGKEMDSFD